MTATIAAMTIRTIPSRAMASALRRNRRTFSSPASPKPQETPVAIGDKAAATRARPLAPPPDPASLAFAPISGDVAADGLSRYDLDFFETAEWSKHLLLAMQTIAGAPPSSLLPDRIADAIANAKAVAAANPYSPPDTAATPLALCTSDEFSFDFSVPPPLNNAVSISFKVEHLNLTPEQRHKLLLLAAEAYDPYSDTVTLSEARGQQDSIDEVSDRILSTKALSARIDRLIAASKDTQDSFTDIPVDLRHAKPPASLPTSKTAFPPEWIQQQQLLKQQQSQQQLDQQQQPPQESLAPLSDESIPNPQL